METYFSRNADVLLKKKHLTQEAFCKRLGKSKSNWANIVKTNNLEMLSQIAEILEIPIDVIIGLNKSKFRISGFIKVNQKTYEIESKEDIRNLLNELDNSPDY